MPSTVVLKTRKDLAAQTHSARQAQGSKTAATRVRFTGGAAAQRRELAQLLRAIKSLMRQTP